MRDSREKGMIQSGSLFSYSIADLFSTVSMDVTPPTRYSIVVYFTVRGIELDTFRPLDKQWWSLFQFIHLRKRMPIMSKVDINNFIHR
jgi:hypothetical protein